MLLFFYESSDEETDSDYVFRGRFDDASTVYTSDFESGDGTSESPVYNVFYYPVLSDLDDSLVISDFENDAASVITALSLNDNVMKRIAEIVPSFNSKQNKRDNSDDTFNPKKKLKDLFSSENILRNVESFFCFKSKGHSNVENNSRINSENSLFFEKISDISSLGLGKDTTCDNTDPSSLSVETDMDNLSFISNDGLVFNVITAQKFKSLCKDKSERIWERTGNIPTVHAS